MSKRIRKRFTSGRKLAILAFTSSKAPLSPPYVTSAVSVHPCSIAGRRTSSRTGMRVRAPHPAAKRRQGCRRPRVPGARVPHPAAPRPAPGNQDTWIPRAHDTAWLSCPSVHLPAVGIIAAPSGLCSHESARRPFDRPGCQSLSQGLGDGTTL